MSRQPLNSQPLFRHSRLRLALWYALVMGLIWSLSGLAMYRLLVQANWVALDRELEAIAGTLHDSLEPMLPAEENPTGVLQQILPELCLAQHPCNPNPSLIQRHTTGISDRTTFYLRLYNHQSQLLAYSPNQPEGFSPESSSALWHPASDANPWQTLNGKDGKRYRQFTLILHGTHLSKRSSGQAESLHHSWGYLQLGRTLAAFDGEVQRMQWILLIGFPVVLGLVAAASWGLAGLAMLPIYKSYQQQQQFTANAAHESRSPLASQLATIEAILRLPPNNAQELQSMLHTVERQGRRLSVLITDLLLLTRLEGQPAEHQSQSCCLNDLVSDLVEEFLELAIAAEIDLAAEITTESIAVRGNESQLYRLVSNLMANALQYTPQAGQVRVRLQRAERYAWITVQDTGIGIAPENQARIFERFYRVDGDRSRQTGGTGLGLAIAEAIVQRHRGRLSVKSELHQGSCFGVSLPLDS